MAPAPALPAGFTRLADQVERLSELMETLTYRMLELEERLAHHEQQQASREESEATAASVAAVERRLEETGERLSRIEAALVGDDRKPGSTGRGAAALQVLKAPAPERGGVWPDPQSLDEEEDPDPFFDEGEQPFMDERIA
jgi:hypothetical protein